MTCYLLGILAGNWLGSIETQDLKDIKCQCWQWKLNLQWQPCLLAPGETQVHTELLAGQLGGASAHDLPIAELERVSVVGP